MYQKMNKMRVKSFERNYACWFIFLKSGAVDHYAYLLTKISSQFHFIIRRDLFHYFIVERDDFKLHFTYQRDRFLNMKFQVCITNGKINSQSFLKLFHNKTEINNTLNLINKDF